MYDTVHACLIKSKDNNTTLVKAVKLGVLLTMLLKPKRFLGCTLLKWVVTKAQLCVSIGTNA